jgi:hypothetical protein
LNTTRDLNAYGALLWFLNLRTLKAIPTFSTKADDVFAFEAETVIFRALFFILAGWRLFVNLFMRA